MSDAWRDMARELAEVVDEGLRLPAADIDTDWAKEKRNAWLDHSQDVMRRYIDMVRGSYAQEPAQ